MADWSSILNEVNKAGAGYFEGDLAAQALKHQLLQEMADRKLREEAERARLNEAAKEEEYQRKMLALQQRETPKVPDWQAQINYLVSHGADPRQAAHDVIFGEAKTAPAEKTPSAPYDIFIAQQPKEKGGLGLSPAQAIAWDDQRKAKLHASEFPKDPKTSDIDKIKQAAAALYPEGSKEYSDFISNAVKAKYHGGEKLDPVKERRILGITAALDGLDTLRGEWEAIRAAHPKINAAQWMALRAGKKIRGLADADAAKQKLDQFLIDLQTNAPTIKANLSVASGSRSGASAAADKLFSGAVPTASDTPYDIGFILNSTTALMKKQLKSIQDGKSLDGSSGNAVKKIPATAIDLSRLGG